MVEAVARWFFLLGTIAWVQVDKVALDALHENAEVHLQSLEPWVQVCS